MNLYRPFKLHVPPPKYEKVIYFINFSSAILTFELFRACLLGHN